MHSSPVNCGPFRIVGQEGVRPNHDISVASPRLEAAGEDELLATRHGANQNDGIEDTFTLKNASVDPALFLPALAVSKLVCLAPRASRGLRPR
jgi:hypothetical protein